MALYGYARVSTSDQDLKIQEETLRAAGCDVIRTETATGTSRTGRVELDLLLQFLRPGDTLVVTRIDRLARSIKDLQDIVYLLRERGITLKATEQPVDTNNAAGKAFLDMLGVFAEFEPFCAESDNLKELPLRKLMGDTMAASRQLIELWCSDCLKKVLELQRLLASLVLAGHQFIENLLKMYRYSVI